MTIRPFLCVFFALAFVSIQLGCTGLQGVRFHDGPLQGDEHCESCDIPGSLGNDAGDASPLGEVAANPAIVAPHSRFHPVPTRPVFESRQGAPAPVPSAGVISDGASVEDASATDDPPAGADDATAAAPTSRDAREAHSVLIDSSPQAVRLAHAEIEGTTEDSSTDESSNEEASSRRKPQVSITTSADEETDAPPTFKPAATAEPSTNDMWRPRVGDQ